MTSKQRSYLKGLAMTMDAVLPDRQVQPHTGDHQIRRGSVKRKRID